MAAGFNITSSTFTVIILLQCFSLCKQGSSALSLKQPKQSKTATTVLNSFPTLSKSWKVEICGSWKTTSQQTIPREVILIPNQVGVRQYEGKQKMRILSEYISNGY